MVQGATLCVTLLLVISYTLAENSYLFVSPKVIRPGVPLTIQGSLLKDVTSPVLVTVTLEKAKPKQRFPDFGPRLPILQEPVAVVDEVVPVPIDDISTLPMKQTTTSTTTTTPAPTTTPPPPEPITTSQLSMSDKSMQTFYLEIPVSLLEGDYQLRIKGRGGLTFENTTSLQYESKTAFVVVQTDKAIYKPGQTVHFRVFGATPDLRIIFDKLDLDLFDPNGNKINQWRISKKDMTDLAGVYVGEMLMSESPVLGDWKFKATVGKEKIEKIITIDEYVLPKFEVSFDLPSFGRIMDTDFTGKVTAKYTYGKPVKGIASVRVRAKWPNFSWNNGTRTKVSKDVEMKFPIDGTESFTVSMDQLRKVQKYLDRSFLIFEANVTETLTGAVMSASEELQFFENPIKLEFPDSLPRNFKPGMAYTAVLKVAEQDDTPAYIPSGEVTVNVSFYKPEIRTTTTTTTTPSTTPQQIMIDGELITIEKPIKPIRIVEPGWWWPRDEELKQPSMSFSIPPDGLVEIPITIPADITRVSLNAEFEKSSAYMSLSKAQSPSNNFIQLKLLTETPKAGSMAEIEVRSTEMTGTALFQVMSKGFVVESGQFDMASGLLRIPVTSNMAPKAKVMVYYVRQDGEVVADGLSFNIDDIFDNQVSIEFSRSMAEPSKKINLTVKADPGSKVNILAVDKSVLLLKSGNDITKDQVRSELQSFDSRGGSPFLCDWFCWRWPMPTGGVDAEDVFENAGVAYLTDALVYNHRENWRGPVAMPMMRGNMVMDDVAFMAAPAPAAMAFREKGGATARKSELKPVQRVRKLFPETWLWKSATTTNGTVVFEDRVPDTITSWVATAFAVHPKSGLGLSDSANLKTFMPFFVRLHLPYSVVRGEKVIVQANVFNYYQQPIYAYVLLSSNPDYDNIHITSWWTSTYPADVARFVKVEPNSATAVYFPIIPRRIGKIDLQVQAQSLFAADAMKKQLIVEPEGTPQEYNFPVLIDLSQQAEYSTTVPISFPPSTVRGSERVTVSVIGDLMGPSIHGLDSLLKMPYGCGEQNMLNFAPNIFITKYLEITNNLDDATFQKSKGYMVKGYQKELTYQHDDGSFSAFGNSDPSGSMWLTAFVLKSFVQAKPYIFVDGDILNKTITWILRYQNDNGTFQEPGKVLHKEMQGGSTAGERSLTSFVLAALLEARSVEGVNEKIADAVAKSVQYLENEISNMTDPYELAIAGYVLTLAGSNKTMDIMNKLQGLATVTDGMKYWTKSVSTDSNQTPWEKRKGNAINIELTGYVLLTLAANDNRQEGLMVLKWLTSQRNPDGGYSSTQDTIVALQALAEMASRVYSKTFDMNIVVKGAVDSSISESFSVNAYNALTLQTRQLPSNIGEVNINAVGRGLSLVEVAVFYNILEDDMTPSFDVKVALPKESLNEFQVEVCTRWLKEGASGMAVIEVGAPSGFAADKQSVKMEGKLKRVEDGNKKLILYLDEIGKAEQCYNVDMQRTELVAGAQPVPVKVYDYYEPTNQVTVFYVPEAVRNSDVCDVCGKECEFCEQNRGPKNV